jgi:polar amino acid transport system substrate-binding protein
MQCAIRIGVLAALCCGPAARAVTIVSSENAPFAYTAKGSGKIVGVSTDLLAEAFSRAGLTPSVEIYPWARAYMMAKNLPETCVFPVTRLAEREAHFRWVGPLSNNKWVLFARADFQGVIIQLSDAGRYAIGGLIDDGPSVFLKAQGLAVDLAGDNRANVKKLGMGRVQLWATGLERGRILAEEMGMHDLKPVFLIKEVAHYMACEPSISGKTIDGLNKALDTMRADGAAQRIMDKYERGAIATTQP